MFTSMPIHRLWTHVLGLSALVVFSVATIMASAPIASAGDALPSGSMHPAHPGTMQSGDMHMDMPMKMSDTPATFAPTRHAYTHNRRFLVKLLSLPSPIPYQTYFSAKLAVFDGASPAKPLPNARVDLFAGMRHGMKDGFAHGMQSAPKVEAKNGIVHVRGLYFHMMGPWVLKITVHDGSKSGVAELRLPCCGK